MSYLSPSHVLTDITTSDEHRVLMALQDLKVLKVSLEFLAREERGDHQDHQENRYNTFINLYTFIFLLYVCREDQVMKVHLGLMESQAIQGKKDPRERRD